MKEIETISFVDDETHQNGVAVIRATKGLVGVALSLESNGDIEVFLSVDISRSLAAAISEAVAIASSNT